MCSLATIIPASEVTDEYREKAVKWGVWDSKGEPKKKFPYAYPKEERVLIISGKATLTPDGGEPPFTIGAGDAVTFHAGFKCKWHVLEPMQKHFQLFEADGEVRLFFLVESCTRPVSCCRKYAWRAQPPTTPCLVLQEAAEAPSIACDGCGGECYPESYFVEEGELDICPTCFKKARGAEKKKYAGAQRQVITAQEGDC